MWLVINVACGSSCVKNVLPLTLLLDITFFVPLYHTVYMLAESVDHLLLDWKIADMYNGKGGGA